jgi:glycosyltransferase involved in cell wall biosynthesis
MRILYCNKYNFRFSGTEAYLFDTMELVRAHGHEVALFSMWDPRGQATPHDRHFVSPIDFKANHSFLSKCRLAAHSGYSIEARRKMRAMIADFRPDVAHVRNIYHHLSPSILFELKARGVPVLYHMNDLQLFCPSYNMVSASGVACGGRCSGGRFWHVVSEGCYSGGRIAAAALAIEAYVHRWLRTYEKCVDLVLAPSQFVKQQLLENGWPDSRVLVLPHFQHLPLKTPPHLGPNAPILYFGRLSAEKGVADLIRAMLQVRELQLVIAGDGPQRGELEELASSLQLRNVSFVGHVSVLALNELIAFSQFTVFPSRAYETFGKSILESFAHARTVIASDLGSRRELIQAGKTGLLYDAGNVDQLVAAIRFLQARPELAKGMGEAGREMVRDRYSPDLHFAALMQIYERLGARTTRIEGRSANDNREQQIKIAYIGGRGVIGKYSGIETYYEETGKRLASSSQGVTVYCRTYFTPAIAQHKGMRIVRLPTIRSKHLETLVHTVLSTAHACFQNYDVVHYHTLGPSLFSFIPRLFGKKTVVTVQGLDWQRRKWSPFARSVLKVGEWTSARLPNKTIVVSKTLEKYYLSRYSRPCAYIPNGTELSRRSDGGHLEKFALRSKNYVLFLGRFSPEKNCHLLINAFEKIETPMKLVLAGGSSHTDDYSSRMRQHASDRIMILDWLSGDTLRDVLANAALFVLPSDMEGLSLSLLEAMGAGVCVLTSDTPENREVVEDCGFTFRAGDEDDLQRMLTLLLNDPELRERAGEKARIRVRQDYLWDEVTQQIAAVYEGLFERSKGRQLPSASQKSA